jgi:predicted SAM-dependent methyltransferase
MADVHVYGPSQPVKRICNAARELPMSMKKTMRIPWWAKIGAKIILSRLPFGYEIWRHLGLFRHGSMDSSTYAINVFRSHVARAGRTEALAGRTILELGPGDSIATAILANVHGARAILLDAGSYARQDIRPYAELETELQKMMEGCSILKGASSVPEILSVCNATYLTEGLASLRSLESASVDMIFSQAVLEHVRRSEFIDEMKQCRRILRPDGVCSHRVDLQDHLQQSLNNLRFSNGVWESELFARSGFYTNRIQYSQMLEIFREAGFEVDVVDVRRWEQLPIARKDLAEEFRNIPEDELRVSGFDVRLYCA